MRPGRRGEVTPPYGSNAGGAQRRADVPRAWPPPTIFRNEIWGVSHGHRPLRPADGRNGWRSEQRLPPKYPATSDNPSVTAAPCQLPLHKGALWTENADCRVASLLAMTVLNLCHSEEAQRADVGIRPFYDGRWFGPPRSSAPTEGLPKSQQRADVGIGPYGWLQRAAATTQAALSEAESAEIAAGQIQVLPDDLRVQHGVLCPEVSARPRPCSRRGYSD